MWKIFLSTWYVDFLDYIYRKNHKNKLVKLLKDIDYLQVETQRILIFQEYLIIKNLFNPTHATFRELKFYLFLEIQLKNLIS